MFHLFFAGARWYLQELSESVATIEAWLAVKTPRQSHVVDLCCGKQGRSGRPCGEPVGVRRSINETSFELTQLVTMVFYDTCQFFLQVNSGFFGWTLLKCLCSELISIKNIWSVGFMLAFYCGSLQHTGWNSVNQYRLTCKSGSFGWDQLVILSFDSTCHDNFVMGIHLL